VKTNLFLVSGVARRLCGSFELKRMGGLYGSAPGLALLFLIPALSLAGVPPSRLFREARARARGAGGRAVRHRRSLAGRRHPDAALHVEDLAGGFLEAGAGGRGGGQGRRRDRASGGIRGDDRPIAVLAAITVCIGIGAGPVFSLSLDAAAQLLDPRDYIRAVMEGRR